MHFNLPNEIDFVLNTLENAGHKAYIVGGCVRDLLCGKKPFDYDITTDATPERVVSLFEKTVSTGLKHGTVTVIIEKTPIEVTTFRAEGTYTDARRPDEVYFIKDINADLSRRDFTVNAMCYNHREGIIDLFDGRADIQSRTLRAVGVPRERFLEDALRILRLFRFSATLGFNIEKNTFNDALLCATSLKNVSAERIFAELRRAVCGTNPEALSPLLESGALEGFELYNICPISPALPQNENLRLFAFLYQNSKNLDKTLDILKASNAFKAYANKMRPLCEKKPPESKADIKRSLSMCEEIFEDFLIYKGLKTDEIARLLRQIRENGEPYKISQLALSGAEIKALGYESQEIGGKLNMLLDLVIENPRLNTKEKLYELLSN